MSKEQSNPFAPTLTTPRLTLELHNNSPEHYKCLIDCFNTPTALKYLGDWNMHTRSDIDKLIAGTLLQWKLLTKRDHENDKEDDGYIAQCCHYHICPKADHPGAGELVGGVILAQRGDDVPPDNGWALLDEFGGNGYATEAAGELLRYVREGLGVREVCAWPNGENVGSVRVAERIGMVKAAREVRERETGDMKVVYVLEGMRWPGREGEWDDGVVEMGHSR